MFSKFFKALKLSKEEENINDYSVYQEKEFRVVTMKGYFYIQKWIPDSCDPVNGGHWTCINFLEDGKAAGLGAYYFARQFERQETACYYAALLNDGAEIIEDFNELKFKVIDCDCNGN